MLWPAEGHTAVTPETSFQGSWSPFGHNWLHSSNLAGSSTSYPWLCVQRNLTHSRPRSNITLSKIKKKQLGQGRSHPTFSLLGTCSTYPEATGRINLGVWNRLRDDYSLQGDIIDQPIHHTDNTISGSRRGAGQELWGHFGEWGRAKRAVHTYNINQETLTENFHLRGIVPSSPYGLTITLCRTPRARYQGHFHRPDENTEVLEARNPGQGHLRKLARVGAGIVTWTAPREFVPCHLPVRQVRTFVEHFADDQGHTEQPRLAAGFPKALLGGGGLGQSSSHLISTWKQIIIPLGKAAKGRFISGVRGWAQKL